MTTMIRPDGRHPHAMRPTAIEPGFMPYAEGSALISMGNTRVICTATASASVPDHAKNSGKGWITAEYAMLPRSSPYRVSRERHGPGGRSQEIQRLIGRSLRAVADMALMEGVAITVDCDVLQADGGTRCASITGGFVALALAVHRLQAEGRLPGGVLRDHLAAISLGIYRGTVVLDLPYAEDSVADTDMNLVMTGAGHLVEVQATAEGAPFTVAQHAELLELGARAVGDLVAMQRTVLEAAGAALRPAEPAPLPLMP